MTKLGENNNDTKALGENNNDTKALGEILTDTSARGEKRSDTTVFVCNRHSHEGFIAQRACFTCIWAPVFAASRGSWGVLAPVGEKGARTITLFAQAARMNSFFAHAGR